MSIERHGITIGIERIGSESVLVFKATGKLTHKDYEAIVPVLDSSLKGINSKHIKMLVDITEFSGWELRAAWDDFQLGLKVGFNIEKIAIYGDKNWQELAAKIGSWFISGEIESFGSYESAVQWLTD
ncbi:SpoIIAA family protein [Vibrio diabolicus]|uniref:STAS/SEC14 domain-containing protein n=1 Tax=Vibrio diabolicus TaxID=50719 RepID=UPI00215F0F4D|nr:STAS/SEC14 domain-containing protein [Vibrio diabolicus]EGQ8079852.1 STAS/SEC14 domain-containing protein [Vibrio vulnificus]EGR0761754.1 STAS/SEC14 domain-containing protein [Vibrio parahaemolyticus]ELA7420872.1 STAS/SEC14 domain-containing protein [Vibrio parahaemolyticus]MCS0316501.1 STAS/SEC14 domain-containing protein [Vibrio diabolicus]